MVVLDSETLYVRPKNKYNATVSLFLSAFVINDFFYYEISNYKYFLDIFHYFLHHLLFQILCKNSESRLSKVLFIMKNYKR